MSREAMLEINCSRYSEKIIDIISLFNKMGWKYFNSKGEVEYLPLGDDDDYDWQKSVLSDDEVRKVINSKQEHSEKIGLNLYYNNSFVGISLLADNTSQILLNLNINRKTINDTRDALTDVTWYIKHIVQKLEAEGCTIEHFKVEEYVD